MKDVWIWAIALSSIFLVVLIFSMYFYQDETSSPNRLIKRMYRGTRRVRTHSYSPIITPKHHKAKSMLDML